MEAVAIKTDRLLLRRARMDDLEDLHAVFSHPEAMRFWDSLPYHSLEQTRFMLEGMVAASPETSDDFIIELEGKAIGKAGCWRIGEIGFILHPDHWGRGLAFEALSAVIPHAFQTLPIDVITADVDPRNGASLHILAKLGFRETGRQAKTIKIGDDWFDSVYLALSRSDQALQDQAKASG